MNDISPLLKDALAACGAVPGDASRGIASATVNGLTVAFERDDRLKRLVLWCSLRDLPAETSSELYEFLLKASLLGAQTGGGHIGLYGPTRALLYSLELDEDGLDAARLSSAIQRFAEKAAGLIEELERFSATNALNSPFMANVIWA